jgi:hypothetical protein
MRNQTINRGFWSGACLLLTVVLFGIQSGCDRKAKSANDSPAQPVPTVDTSDGKPLPDEAIRTLLTAIQEGDAGVIWESLPPTHHAEINGLIRTFAGKMDKEVWERMFVVARRIVKLLRTKRDLILENPELKVPTINWRLFSENWDEVIALLELIVDSELANLDKLRTFDGKTFFSETGARFLKQVLALSAKDPNDPFRKGFNAKVRLVAIDGSEATIGLTTGGTFVMTRQAVDEKPKETQMKLHRIDGVWIVAELDYGLTGMYKDGQAFLAEIPDDVIRKNRGRLLKLLKTVDEDLDRIELAKTSQELILAVGLAQARVRQLVQAETSGMPESATAEEKGPRGRTVTVVVNGTLNKATRQRILDRLNSLKRAGGAPKVTDGDTVMTVILPTDRFLQDVVDAIDFGSVTEVDEVERQLTVTASKKQAKQNGPGQ